MKKLFVAGALVGLMTSCGSVLSLNPSYGQAEENAVVEPAPEPVVETTPVEESTPSTALLGSLLGALAGNGATESNSDGTALTTGGVVTGLLGSILNAFTSVDENSIVGTWNFKGSAFVFESENALASLGSDAVATQVEAKVDQYLAKYGIQEDACSITFNDDDTYLFLADERYIEGKYELNKETKELTMTLGMFKTTANLVYDAGTINLVYQSDGLLRLVKAIGAKGTSGTFALFSKLLDQYDGMRIGMAFAK